MLLRCTAADADRLAEILETSIRFYHDLSCEAANVADREEDTATVDAAKRLLRQVDETSPFLTYDLRPGVPFAFDDAADADDEGEDEQDADDEGPALDDLAAMESLDEPTARRRHTSPST